MNLINNYMIFRITNNTIMVDETCAVLKDGNWTGLANTVLTDKEKSSILDFIKEEKRFEEHSSSVAVTSLLDELGIVKQIK